MYHIESEADSFETPNKGDAIGLFNQSILECRLYENETLLAEKVFVDYGDGWVLETSWKDDLTESESTGLFIGID